VTVAAQAGTPRPAGGRTDPRPHRGCVRADPPAETVESVILLSKPRREGVATLVVLPRGARLVARFTDDGSARDLTETAADLITEYLLRGGEAAVEQAGDETVQVAQLELQGGDVVDVRLASIDLFSGEIGEIPPGRLLPLLGGAIAMAVADAVEAENAPD